MIRLCYLRLLQCYAKVTLGCKELSGHHCYTSRGYASCAARRLSVNTLRSESEDELGQLVDLNYVATITEARSQVNRLEEH